MSAMSTLARFNEKIITRAHLTSARVRSGARTEGETKDCRSRAQCILIIISSVLSSAAIYHDYQQQIIWIIINNNSPWSLSFVDMARYVDETAVLGTWNFRNLGTLNEASKDHNLKPGYSKTLVTSNFEREIGSIRELRAMQLPKSMAIQLLKLL